MDSMFSAMQDRLREAFTELVSSTSAKFVEIAPQLLFTLIVLVVGVIVAHLSYKLVLKLSDVVGLDKLAGKVNIDRALRLIGIRRTLSRILGLLVYWFAVFFVLLLLSKTLDLGTASDAIGAIVSYIPNLIIGLLLLVFGLLIGRFLRDIVSSALVRTGVTASTILGHLTQVVIILFACLLALRQIGFDVSIITTNVAIILAVLLATSGLALSMGLRPLLEQAFCSRQLKQLLKVGDHIELNGVSGTVVAITLTHVVLQNAHGDLLVPANDFFVHHFIRQSDNR